MAASRHETALTAMRIPEHSAVSGAGRSFLFRRLFLKFFFK